MNRSTTVMPFTAYQPLHILLSARGLIAWVVFAAALLLTVLISLILQEQQNLAAAKQFQFYEKEVQETLLQRLKRHEQILLGGAGLFDTSERVTRDQWRIYIERLQLHENYPGIQGVGFSTVIQPHERVMHIDTIRAEGFPDYSLRPPGERDIYTAIIYLEPFVDRNLAAFGYDMYSEPVRRAAMDRAVNSGTTAITGKVRLVQETHGREQAGFLMYVPIYRSHMALDTAEQRWQALQGFVYSPYRVDDLMDGLLGSSSSFIDFTIYDGEQVNPDSLMYQSSHHGSSTLVELSTLNSTLRLDTYGQIWTVLLDSRPQLLDQFSSPLFWLMPLFGISISLLLLLLILTLLSRKEQALALASELTNRKAELEAHVSERTAELQTSNELLQKVLSSATAFSIIATDTNDLITVFNSGAEKLLGYSANEMLGKQAAELHLAKYEGAEARQWTYVHKSGRHISVSLVMSQMINNSGSVTGYLAIAEDITERLVAQSKLADQVQHNQAILDQMIDGLITIDAKGIVQSFNLAATDIFGYSCEEVIGRNVNMLMPSPHREAHDGYLRNFQTSGVARIIGIGREVEGRRQDGSLFPMDLAVSPITRQGESLYVGMVRDISERKRTEQLKSEFVSTVSHELRTPLTSISGALSLMASGKLGVLPEQLKTLLDVAQKNNKQLNFLINDLLDMEKLLAGKMLFDLQVQPLQPLLEQALQDNKAYADGHGVSLVLKTGPAVIDVLVDSHRLQQVMANLLSNAAKFSPEGSEVSITLTRDEDLVRVSVQDQGPGIPEQFQERIFEKFAQADGSKTRQQGGTGLGLAITRELIERMGGRIGFTSEADKGATFYFELPWH